MGKKAFFIIFASLIYLFPLSVKADAAKTPRCTVAEPATSPVLVDAKSGNNSVTLIWIEAADPVTHYLLQYGTSKDSLIYGAPYIGPKGTIQYTVNQLNTGTRYYFQVVAINECRAGDPSNTLSVVTGVRATDGVSLPRMSFYKTVIGGTQSAKINSVKKTTPFVATSAVQKCANGCYSWQLLLGEIVALMLFFAISYKYLKIMPVLSVLIPLIVGFLFYKINGTCSSQEFLCKYFYLLNLIFFIGIITIQKQQLMHKTMGKSLISI